MLTVRAVAGRDAGAELESSRTRVPEGATSQIHPFTARGRAAPREERYVVMLTRWDPFTEMSRLQDELFRSTFAPRNGAARATFSPPVDVYEDADAIFVHAELPGLRLEDVTVGVENDVLTFSGERKGEREDGHAAEGGPRGSGYFLRERWVGAFSRSFKLPRTVDVEKIEATLKEGILTVRLPKRENVKARRIEVKS